jgi:hypothetical protein
MNDESPKSDQRKEDGPVKGSGGALREQVTRGWCEGKKRET